MKYLLADIVVVFLAYLMTVLFIHARLWQDSLRNENGKSNLRVRSHEMFDFSVWQAFTTK
jgi:hypothetical protein